MGYLPYHTTENLTNLMEQPQHLIRYSQISSQSINIFSTLNLSIHYYAHIAENLSTFTV